MDFAKILAQLREELKNIDTAIQTLEKLQQTSRRRNRPALESEAPDQAAPRLPAALKNAGADRSPGTRQPKRSDPTPT
jgi:hypothetical protein